ncbi:MAG: adenylate/guanylate cyclase domain-containing protein, partial [Phenylobacterium sp.]
VAAERVERRLAAVLAADMVGYSRLMERDEQGTLERLKARRRELVGPLVAAHRGRIVKLMGDGALVEFASVVDAVACAVAVQRGMAEREAGVPEAERIRFRIGVNLGDVIVEGTDLLGDGVNVAARLEQLAEPDGVVISGTAFDQLRGGFGWTFASLGEQHLKNIERPVRAYRMIPAGADGDAHPPEQPALLLPDKPSLAVLPFDNLSGDPEQGYFADGIVEDIVTALSRVSGLFVIARNSGFAYRGLNVDVRRVARELGVRYVLEGSVRRAGDRVRIAGQLVDATTGGHLWADRFDGTLGDVFDLQDRVAEAVAGAIEPTLRRAEVERARRKPTGSLDAYDLYLRALPHVFAYRAEDNAEAMPLLDRALALDPGYAVVRGFSSTVVPWQFHLIPSEREGGADVGCIDHADAGLVVGRAGRGQGAAWVSVQPCQRGGLRRGVPGWATRAGTA